MKILVSGTREATSVSYGVLVETLPFFPPGTILVHGAAPGIDTLAADYGKSLGFVLRPYPANWGKYGKRAGPIRNQQMLDCEHLPEEPIDFALLYPSKASIGTIDMRDRLQKTGIPFLAFDYLTPLTLVL